MFGTVTLKGIQEKNIFVDENKNIYKICNSWIIPPRKIVRWVQLQKTAEDSYKLIRSINIEYIDDQKCIEFVNIRRSAQVVKEE